MTLAMNKPLRGKEFRPLVKCSFTKDWFYHNPDRLSGGGAARKRNLADESSRVISCVSMAKG